MKRFHIAIGVANIQDSIEDYSVRLGQPPDVIIADEYALWRTSTLNFSIRKTSPEQTGTLRHLGWESPDVTEFSMSTDINHIPWEHFTIAQQDEEIQRTWPGRI